MARKKKGKTLSVKLDEDVIESARVVAAIENVPLTDLLSGILRPVLAERERDAIEKRARDLNPRKGRRHEGGADPDPKA